MSNGGSWTRSHSSSDQVGAVTRCNGVGAAGRGAIGSKPTPYSAYRARVAAIARASFALALT